MNVLFLTHSFPRDDGDIAGSFILRLAVALARRDVTVTVMAPHAPGLKEHATLKGVAVRRFRYAPERYETLAYRGTMAEQVRSSWVARFALAGLVARAAHVADRMRRETSPQLLHAHWWFPSGIAAATVSAVRGVPLVTTLHGSDVRLADGIRGARSIYSRVASRSSAVTAVSSWLASRAQALAPDLPVPMVAPMPADVELLSPGGVRALDRLLFVGRLTPQKGVDTLLRAVATLPATLSLDVVGDGPEGARLRQLAASLGVAPRVRWHPAMPQLRLLDFYRSATALVVPSIDEGLGLVAVEAQLCETPVIAFDSGGLRDIVADGVSGILARPNDAAGLVGAVSDLLQRPDRGVTLGREGRARALARFAPDAVARQYVDIYKEAIAHFHERKG